MTVRIFAKPFVRDGCHLFRSVPAGRAGRGRFTRQGCQVFRSSPLNGLHVFEAFRSRAVPCLSLCIRWPRRPLAFQSRRVPLFPGAFESVSSVRIHGPCWPRAYPSRRVPLFSERFAWTVCIFSEDFARERLPFLAVHPLASLAALERGVTLLERFAWTVGICSKLFAREGCIFFGLHSLASLAAGVSLKRGANCFERFAWTVCIFSRRFARERCPLFRPAFAGLARRWRFARERHHIFRAVRLD